MGSRISERLRTMPGSTTMIRSPSRTRPTVPATDGTSAYPTVRMSTFARATGSATPSSFAAANASGRLAFGWRGERPTPSARTFQGGRSWQRVARPARTSISTPSGNAGAMPSPPAGRSIPRIARRLRDVPARSDPS